MADKISVRINFRKTTSKSLKYSRKNFYFNYGLVSLQSEIIIWNPKRVNRIQICLLIQSRCQDIFFRGGKSSNIKFITYLVGNQSDILYFCGKHKF